MDMLIQIKMKTQQCKGRWTNEKQELKFPLRSGYFTERRCNCIGIIDELCGRCKDGSLIPFVSKGQQSRYQGKVDEPYFEGSWLFGSPRFLKMAAIPENQLTGDALTEAMEAQRTARGGIQMGGGGGGKSDSVPKKKDEVKVKVKVKTKPLENAVITPRGVSNTTTNPTPLAIESREPAIEAESVLKIVLRPLVIDGKTFWYNSVSHTVYERIEYDGVGPHIGIWNASEKKLVPISSDAGIDGT